MRRNRKNELLSRQNGYALIALYNRNTLGKSRCSQSSIHVYMHVYYATFFSCLPPIGRESNKRVFKYLTLELTKFIILVKIYNIIFYNWKFYTFMQCTLRYSSDF